MFGGDGEEGLSSMMMGKEEVVVTDAVEAVSSSRLVPLDRKCADSVVCSEQGASARLCRHDQPEGLSSSNLTSPILWTPVYRPVQGASAEWGFSYGMRNYIFPNNTLSGASQPDKMTVNN